MSDSYTVGVSVENIHYVEPTAGGDAQLVSATDRARLELHISERGAVPVVIASGSILTAGSHPCPLYISWKGQQFFNFVDTQPV